MRLLLITLCAPLICATARGDLYVAKKSRSPDGTVKFAIDYLSIDQAVEGSLHGCFVDPKTKKRIGGFFYLEGVDADTNRPGSYYFDYYHRFDFVWSADSTHVAVIYNMRHSNRIYPFRRRGSSFQRLQMPDLDGPLEKRLHGTLALDHNRFTNANRWTRSHRLIATISQDAKLSSTGNDSKDWPTHSLRFTIAFDADGQPRVEATRCGVRITP